MLSLKVCEIIPRITANAAKPQPDDTFAMCELEDTLIVLRRVLVLCTKPPRLRRFKQRGCVDQLSRQFVPNWDSPNGKSEWATARTALLLVELVGVAT